MARPLRSVVLVPLLLVALAHAAGAEVAEVSLGEMARHAEEILEGEVVRPAAASGRASALEAIRR